MPNSSMKSRYSSLKSAVNQIPGEGYLPRAVALWARDLAQVFNGTHFRRTIRLAMVGVCFLLSVRGAVGQAARPATVLPSPAHLTSEQDHQRLMELLHITELRRGPDGDPKSPNAANVDESKVPPYTLPDPLRFNSGQVVKTASDWWAKRRPEIVEDFDREIYGRLPAKTPAVKWEVVSTTKQTEDGVPAVTKELVGHVDNS